VEFNEVSLIEGFNDGIQRAAEELEERTYRPSD